MLTYLTEFPYSQRTESMLTSLKSRLQQNPCEKDENVKNSEISKMKSTIVAAEDTITQLREIISCLYEKRCVCELCNFICKQFFLVSILLC